MLKTRIITAAFIAIIAFGLLFFAPPWLFRLAISGLWLVGSWEFGRLAGLGKIGRWVMFILQSLLIGLMLGYWSNIEPHALAFLVAAVLVWCIMFLRLITFRAGSTPGLNYRLVSFFCGLASISFAFYSLAWLRAQSSGEFLILLLLFIIWAADTGAYFAGKQWGRHKLAPSISPGKTREGLLGGLVLAIGIAIILAAATISLPAPLALFVLVVVITALVSAAGDLFISLHKRTVGMKDSGKLFPGHGGVLDRFDSLLAGAPFFALGFLILSQ